MLGCTGDEVSPLIDKKGVGEKTIEKFCIKWPELIDFENPLALEKIINQELKYFRPDFHNKLQHNIRLVRLDHEILPDKIRQNLEKRSIELIPKSSKTTYSIEEVLSNSEYFI